MFELRHHFFIESARFLPLLPEGHPCKRLHGHSFTVVLVLRGTVDNTTGWVMDFQEIQKRAAALFEKIDHRVLNDVPGLENPTSELLCLFIYENLKSVLPLLHKVIVRETRDTECSYPA